MKRSNLGLIVLGLSSLLLLPSVASATGSGGYDTGWGDTAAPDETEGDATGGAGGDTGGGSSPATSDAPSSDSGTTGDDGSATEGETDGDMDDSAVDRPGCTIGAGSPVSGLTALAVLGLVGLRRRRGASR